MAPNQKKLLIAGGVALLVIAIVAYVLHTNKKKADEQAAAVAESNANNGSQNNPSPVNLGLQTWDLILEAIRKKKAAKTNTDVSAVTLSKQEVTDAIQEEPSLVLS